METYSENLSNIELCFSMIKAYDIQGQRYHSITGDTQMRFATMTITTSQSFV